jgi:hypothetical protein
MSKKERRKSIELTDPLEIAFIRWVRTLPREALPDLVRTLQAQAEQWPAQKTRAAMLKFLRAAGYRLPCTSVVHAAEAEACPPCRSGTAVAPAGSRTNPSPTVRPQHGAASQSCAVRPRPRRARGQHHACHPSSSSLIPACRNS